MMKRLFLIAVLTLIIPPNAQADGFFDEIRSAIENRKEGDTLITLKNKYKGRMLSGEGYVLEVKNSNVVNGVDVYLLEEFGKESFMGDVDIEVPAGSPYLDIAKDLRKGQKVSFKGRFDGIFFETIYVRGSVEIATE